jgi:alpha-tubulin suppressor-like RCC1 family protein
VAAGELHSCAASTTTEAYCWGNNTQGQAGLGNDRDQIPPLEFRVPDTWKSWLAETTPAAG